MPDLGAEAAKVAADAAALDVEAAQLAKDEAAAAQGSVAVIGQASGTGSGSLSATPTVPAGTPDLVVVSASWKAS